MLTQLSTRKDDGPVVLRAPQDMVRMLMALPPEWRSAAFADDAGAHAAQRGDADEALFWSEVCMLLQACDEAGMVVPQTG